MKHLFQLLTKNCCICFFSSFALLGKHCLLQGMMTLPERCVLRAGLDAFVIILFSYCNSSEASPMSTRNRTTKCCGECTSVSLFYLRDLVLFILQYKHKRWGKFQLLKTVSLLKVSQLNKGKNSSASNFLSRSTARVFWQWIHLPLLYCTSYFKECFCSGDTRGWCSNICLVLEICFFYKKDLWNWGLFW